MLLVFLPALGDFVSAQLLGGSSTFMIGNLVQQQFVECQNWPLGSAMTVAMMAALTVLWVRADRGEAPPEASHSHHLGTRRRSAPGAAPAASSCTALLR